jgi:hypothetical protein
MLGFLQPEHVHPGRVYAAADAGSSGLRIHIEHTGGVIIYEQIRGDAGEF